MQLISIIIFFVVLLLGAFLIAKNEVTFSRQVAVSIAMHAYNMHQISIHECDNLLDYDDIEPYMKTFWRLWDWGYKRLLPPDKFELIKPYLSKP